MNTLFVRSLLILLLLVAFASPAGAGEKTNSGVIAADALIARPLCFAATVAGSALFLVSLPVAATSHSVKRTAHALVVKPARATFVRPMGDLSHLSP